MTPEEGASPVLAMTSGAAGVAREGWGAIGSGAVRGGGFKWLIDGALADGAVPGGCSGSVFLTMEMACVEARAGAFVWCEIGSRPAGGSIRPLFTKTLADVFVTVTRGGCTPILPELVAGGGSGGADERVAAGFSASTSALLTPMLVEDEGVFCGKRGVVFACGGEPVNGGAAGFCASAPEGGRETLGIGFVTAVDQAGAPVCGAGSREVDALMGKVVAAEMLGRAAGAILVDAGFIGRGGRLMRNVSRLGALGSGLAESAIIILFIVISEKVQWRNLQS
jgi:hypothetical protein